MAIERQGEIVFYGEGDRERGTDRWKDKKIET